MNVAAPSFLGSGREREAVEQHLFHQDLGWDASLLTATSPTTWAFFLSTVFSDTRHAFPKSKSPLAFQQLFPSHHPPTHTHTHTHTHILPWARDWMGTLAPAKRLSHTANIILVGATTSHS